jgi:CDP-glucose 4,6-dehydratase
MEFGSGHVEDVAVAKSFWKDRRILLTGHTGFKGSWLSLWLQRLGAEVVGFSVGIPTTPSLFELAEIGSGVRSIIGDVRDKQAVSKAIADAAPELIIHLAAQSIVLRSYEDPLTTFETNVLGTMNVLDAMRTQPTVRAALIVTSDKCYARSQSSAPHTEDDALGGSDPYSSSKACAELVTQAYRTAFFSQSPSRRPVVATARAGNVIGGGDWAPFRIVPDLIRAFEAGEPASVRNPQHVRPWQHVLDPLAGYLVLCEQLLLVGSEFAEAWNFGPALSASGISVESLVEQMAAVFGNGARWRRADDTIAPGGTSQMPREREDLRLDPTKAMRRLGWMPRLDTARSIRWTIDWYKEVAAGRSARSVTLRQIEQYHA